MTAERYPIVGTAIRCYEACLKLSISKNLEKHKNIKYLAVFDRKQKMYKPIFSRHVMAPACVNSSENDFVN